MGLTQIPTLATTWPSEAAGDQSRSGQQYLSPLAAPRWCTSVLMGADDDGLIDHIFEVWIVRDSGERAPRDTLPAPAAETAEDIVTLAESFRRVATGRAGTHQSTASTNMRLSRPDELRVRQL